MSDPIIYYGTIVHSNGPLEILEDAFIAVDPDGVITAVGHHLSPDELPETLAALGLAAAEVRRLAPGQLLAPGFVDAHNHAPQWEQRGLGQGMPILDWLAALTFPNEARFRDPRHAERVYPLLVRGMLRQGVTTASYYASLHPEATNILAATCAHMGQRALIGKCNMDRNSPDYCREESAEASLADTAACIAYIKAADPAGTLVRPVLTPRFAISTTPRLLAGLGDMARADPSLAIQTHFCEAQQEIAATLELFPEFASEADLYGHFGLLTPRSILAHCTLATPYDLDVLQRQGCGVAHCPTANMTVGGGFMAAPVREFLRRGLAVGLGTDCGGGYSSSMLDAMRHALIASNARAAETNDPDAVLSLDEVFHMATLGGANLVGRGHEIGNFQVGKEFDALLIDMRAERGGVNAPIEETDTTRTVFEKYVMTGDDRNIVQVFVKGRVVHGL